VSSSLFRFLGHEKLTIQQSHNGQKMSASNPIPARLSRGKEDRKSDLTEMEPEPVFDGDDGEVEVEDPCLETEGMERRLVRKIDIRLCTIAGVLCSLNLLDRFDCLRDYWDNQWLTFCSGIISSASVTSIFGDLGLGEGNRYVNS
jgi:hypothetical protein